MGTRRITISRIEVILTLLLAGFFLISALLMRQLPGLLNWLGIFIFLFCVYTYKHKSGQRIFNPYTIFQLFMILFNYGQPIMWAIGIHTGYEIGTTPTRGHVPTIEEVENAQLYTCLAMLIFHIGTMCFTNRAIGLVENIDKLETLSHENNNIAAKSALRQVCSMLLLIVAPVVIVFRAYELTVARKYGYIALYYGSHMTQSGYIHIVLYFFFPAIIGYLVGNDYSRKSRLIAYSIFGIYAVLGLLAGDRGGWIYSLLVLLWLHTFYIKKPIFTYIKYGVLGLIVLYIMNAIVAVRDTGLSNFGKIIERLLSFEGSPIVDVFFEMGGSMNILTHLLVVGREIFPYGNTYLAALLGMVSSRILGLLGIEQVLIANWYAQDYLNLSYGTGFTMIAEAYVNGGYFGGLIYLFILGGILGKLLRYTSNVSASTPPLRIFVLASGLNVLLGLIRGAMYLTLKEMFYGVFVTYIFVKVLMMLRRRA